MRNEVKDPIPNKKKIVPINPRLEFQILLIISSTPLKYSVVKSGAELLSKFIKPVTKNKTVPGTTQKIRANKSKINTHPLFEVYGKKYGCVSFLILVN